MANVNLSPYESFAKLNQARLPVASFIVRFTHWTFAIAFFLFIFSSFPILIAHPRFYWGETGSIGTHPLFVLPLPLLVGHSGWGRALHFLSAWIALFAGLLYVIGGLVTRHFRNDLLPSLSELSWRNLRSVMVEHMSVSRASFRHSFRYNVLQQITYLSVVFLCFPLISLTGLAMSPAVTSIFPALVTIFGGHQSARTLHFFLAQLLVAFFIVHVAMVILAGFYPRTKAMVTGRIPIEAANKIPRKDRRWMH